MNFYCYVLCAWLYPFDALHHTESVSDVDVNAFPKGNGIGNIDFQIRNLLESAYDP